MSRSLLLMLVLAGAGCPNCPFSCGGEGGGAGGGGAGGGMTAGNPGIDITLMGEGGTVTSMPAGINCPGTCSADYPAHASVTLLAVADETHRFVRWQGDPACTEFQVYVDTMRVHCTAVFEVRTGSDWLAAGAALNAGAPTMASSVGGIDVRFVGTGAPVVAWVENEALRVSRWSGTGWMQLGGRVNTLAASATPSLGSDGTAPVVAWQENSATSSSQDVFVARFDGTAWVKLGGVLNGGMVSDLHGPSLSLTSTGGVAVAWAEQLLDGTQRIMVRRWSGTAWENAGLTEGPPAATFASEPRLVLAGTAQQPVLTVAWRADTGMKVATLNGMNWTVQADPFPAISNPVTFDLGTSYSDGIIAAAQTASGGTFQVRKLDQGAWLNLGPARGTAGPGPGGLNVTLSHAFNEDPLIAWTKRTAGVDEVVVELYTSGAWVQRGHSVASVNRQGIPGLSQRLAVANGPKPVLVETVLGMVGGAADHAVKVYEFR